MVLTNTLNTMTYDVLSMRVVRLHMPLTVNLPVTSTDNWWAPEVPLCLGFLPTVPPQPRCIMLIIFQALSQH